MIRRLAAMLAADVVGFSRLMGDDEAGTLAALKALRKDLVAPAIAGHKGRVIVSSWQKTLLRDISTAPWKARA